MAPTRRFSAHLVAAALAVSPLVAEAGTGLASARGRGSPSPPSMVERLRSMIIAAIRFLVVNIGLPLRFHSAV